MAKDVIILNKEALYFARCEKKQSLYGIVALKEIRCEEAPLYTRESGEIIFSEDCFSHALKQLTEKLHIKLDEVRVILPHGVTWYHYLVVDDLPKTQKEAENFISWKLQKVLPIPKEEAKLTYHVLAKGRGETKLLIAATFDNVIKTIESTLEKRGLLITHLVPPTIAFLNVFSQSFSANSLVCWFRENAYSMVAVVNRYPVAIREVDMPIKEGRMEGELFSFQQSIKESYPDFDGTKIYYFDESQRSGLAKNFTEVVNELAYKELIKAEDKDIASLPKFISAFGTL